MNTSLYLSFPGTIPGEESSSHIHPQVTELSRPGRDQKGEFWSYSQSVMTSDTTKLLITQLSWLQCCPYSYSTIVWRGTAGILLPAGVKLTSCLGKLDSCDRDQLYTLLYS